MPKIKWVVLIFVLSWSTSVLSAGMTAWGKVTEVYVNKGWTMVQVSGIADNPDGCTSTTYYSINPNDSNYKVLHSTLVSALALQKKVKFWINSCGGQGMNYPQIESIFMSVNS